MHKSLPDEHFSLIASRLTAEMGLRFPPERRRDLERGIESAAREFGFQNAESCARWLLSSPLTRSQIEILASHLTVGETYLFRDKKSFEILEERAIPEWIHSRRNTERRLRIWSAGCCTGEEPYSLAMLLDRRIPDLKEWNITILATDINPRFLQKASEGIYGEWSFRDTPSWIKELYFRKRKEGRYEILPSIKKMVTFAYLNLAEDVYPSLSNGTNAMDVIFCRNVLMYFDTARAEKAVHNFHRSLAENGWLIVSPSESSHTLFRRFSTIDFPGVVAYAKSGRKIERDESKGEESLSTIAASPSSVDADPESENRLSRETGGLYPDGGESEAVDPVGPYREAVLFYSQGRYGYAESKIGEWRLRHPEDADAMALLARVCANQGRLDEALEWCEKAIAADKLHAGHYFLYATILQERAQEDEALQSLSRALYLDPGFVLAHFVMGILARRRGRSEQSEKHFRNALALLAGRRPEEVLPESEGITAGRLSEIIQATVDQETSA